MAERERCGAGDVPLRVHRLLPRSYANGPGARAVVWVQGCTLGCPGCFNPETHPAGGGRAMAVGDLAGWVREQASGENPVGGLTVSGGEPLQQPAALLRLLRRVRRETPLSCLLFTGFSWEEVEQTGLAGPLAACVDVVVAGRYQRGVHLGRGLLGSSNQTVRYLSDRYTPADLENVPPAELIVGPGGELQSTGIDPVAMGSGVGIDGESFWRSPPGE